MGYSRPFHALNASSRLSLFGPLAPQFEHTPLKPSPAFWIVPLALRQNGQGLGRLGAVGYGLYS
jgi:hypothetical protein